MGKKRKYSWRERFYSFLISIFCIAAAVLVVAIVADFKLNTGKKDAVQSAFQTSEATPEPLTLRAAEATTTPEVSANITPEPEEPEIAEPSFEFLPVYSRANTTENVIAITLDDCAHLTNVKYAVMAAQEAGAKLTLFPMGQNVMGDGMAEVIRTCVFELGFEVENRTWSNALIYRLADKELAAEIWSADVAVDYVLNKEYDMHLFRMRGGLGVHDARTHAYLKQLGYDAIITWSASGPDLTAEELKQSLSPGNIYLFNSTEDDVKKMIELMQYAAARGYRMVTLNELLGYDENSYADPETSILSQTMPLLENYEPLMLSHQIGDRAWQVLLIQNRLAELGYLCEDGADGVFGAGTSSAVSAFQVNCGMLGTGVASTETQMRLFADDAPRCTSPTAVPTATPSPEPEQE